MIQALRRQVAVFRDVLAEYALDLRVDRRSLRKFEVAPAMRNEVRRRLAERGVTLTDSVVGRAAKLLDDEIGYEIARYVFGPVAERRRGIDQDRQVQRAVDLVRGTSSPQQLLGILPRSSGH